jgi:hypothetical protein
VYYDPKEHVEREPSTAATHARVQRDIVGLAVMILGALCTLIAAYAWSAPAGITLTGVYLMVGGWFVASDRSS